MGLPRAELVGGPLDGQRLSPSSSRPPFIWVAQAGRGVRVHGEPTAKRHLYRSIGRAKFGEVFIYAANTHRLCECGGYNEVGEGEKTPHCELCGEPLLRQPV